MNPNIRKYIVGLFFMVPTVLSAQRSDFTAAEQQQISIATPGLFRQSNSFTVDFGQLGGDDYSFPLPVGKATVQGGQALEIVTSRGDAVKAMFSGTVRLSRKTPQYGNTIIIRHDNGLETVYARNAENLVKVGQRVKAGQTIAIVGGGGAKYACTFAFMVNGGWINPSTLIDPASHNLHREAFVFKKQGRRVSVAQVATEKVERNVERSSSNGSIVSLDPDDTVEDYKAGKTIKVDFSQLGRSHWAYPLPGSHVISPYGGKRHHGGVDIKTRPNDKILAAFDGVVTRACSYFGYGNCIVIRHAYGFETLYSHQSKNFVRVGQRVKAGEVIGLTGRTGRATTEHLHFEVSCKGKRMNPAMLFNHGRKTLQSVVFLVSKNTFSSRKG